MHRYSNAQGNMVGPCPCGVFHGHNNHCSYIDDYSNSSSVDCTLSLGTPSTRRTSFSSADNHHHQPTTHDVRRSGGSRLSNFCWDFLQQTNSKHHSSTKSNSSHHRPTTTAAAAASNGGDPLLARRCANCDTTSTPLWRNGPRGPKSLCNACGIRYKKEERRATAAASTNMGGAGAMMESHVGGYNYGGGWGAHQGQKVQYLSPAGAGSEFRFIDDVVSAESGRDSESGMQFLSWRLNVTDRPTSQLVYDFTR